ANLLSITLSREKLHAINRHLSCAASRVGAGWADIGYFGVRCVQHYLICRNWKFIVTLPSGMKNGIGDGGSGAHNTNFSHALDAQRVHVPIVFLDEYHLYIVNIGIGWYMVFSQIMIHESPCMMVHHAVLVQRLADPPDDTAHNLICRGLGVEDFSG